MNSTIVLMTAGVVVVGIVLLLLTRHAGWSITETRQMVSALVEAAEQMMPGQEGAEKLEWVMSKADEIGITKHIDATLLRAMIESSVLWLRHVDSPASSRVMHRDNRAWLDRG